MHQAYQVCWLYQYVHQTEGCRCCCFLALFVLLVSFTKLLWRRSRLAVVYVLLLLEIGVGLNDTYYISFFYKISVFYQIQRGVDLVEYVPQLAREIIVHSAQNHHYSSCARGNHPCGGSAAVGLTRRQVSVPLGVKSITNPSHYNAQRDKVSATALAA